MTRKEIINTPELVDFMVDRSIIADSREKLRKRLEEVCNLAVEALEQEPIDNDAISRTKAIGICKNHGHDNSAYYISKLPPVVPKPKTGYWKAVYQGDEIIDYRCTECEFGNTFGKSTYRMNYCPNCGAKMIDP